MIPGPSTILTTMCDTENFYKITITSGGDRDLNNLPESIQDLVEKELAETLSTNPRAGKTLSEQPSHIRAYDFEELVVQGEYRAGYVIDDKAQKCIVLSIGPRENFYDHMLRKVSSALDHRTS